jgi:hypothetical protein
MAKFTTDYCDAVFYVGEQRYQTSGTGFETDDKSVAEFLRQNSNFTEVTDSNKPVEKVVEKPVEKEPEIEKVKDEPETKKAFFSK